MGKYEINSFEGGCNDYIDPAFLKSSQAQELVNALISSGKLEPMKTNKERSEEPETIHYYENYRRSVVKWNGKYYWSNNVKNPSTEADYGGSNNDFVMAVTPDVSKFVFTPSNNAAVTAPSCIDIAYGNGVYVGISSSAIYYSSDASFWHEVIINEFNAGETWNSIAFGNGTFVILNSNGRLAKKSVDGQTWTNITNLTSGDAQRRPNLICFGNGAFVAYNNSTRKIFYSTDTLLSWTRLTTLTSTRRYNFNKIKFVNGNYYLLGTGAGFFNTPDNCTHVIKGDFTNQFERILQSSSGIMSNAVIDVTEFDSKRFYCINGIANSLYNTGNAAIENNYVTENKFSVDGVNTGIYPLFTFEANNELYLVCKSTTELYVCKPTTHNNYRSFKKVITKSITASQSLLFGYVNGGSKHVLSYSDALFNTLMSEEYETSEGKLFAEKFLNIKATFVYSNAESGAIDLPQVTNATSRSVENESYQVKYTEAFPDALITGINLYVNNDNSESYYKVATITAPNTNVLLVTWDTFTMDDIIGNTEVSDIEYESARAGGKYLTECQGTFFVAVGSKVYFSVHGEIFQWNSLYFIEFDDTITGGIF